MRRFKAAGAALPYERPKLEAVATFNANGDFGTMLERGIAASNAAREPRMIEAQGKGSKPNGHHSSPAEVSSTNMGNSFAPLRRRA